MSTETDRTENCEWCGDAFTPADTRSKGIKEGVNVAYHEECIVHDMTELESSQYGYDTILLSW